MDTPPAPARGLTSGHIAVIGMIAVAVLASAFAWWWNFQRGRKALEFYGTEGANLIRTAPDVKVIVAGERTIDISKAPGLLNARTSLLDDVSYDWTAKDPFADYSDISLTFSRGAHRIRLFFDLEAGTIQISPEAQTAKLKQKTADGWKTYLQRQLKSVEATD